ncbi:hypothetical protein P7C70_g6469, partial [Phenoliferia sp. Uapishka_3]
LILIFCASYQERLNRLADEVGRRLEIQTIEHRPSIGKFDAASAALEPTARDSLFSTAIPKPSSSPQPQSSEFPHPLSAAAMRMPAYPSPSPSSLDSIPPVQNPWADVPSSRHDVDIQKAAMMMERPQFVIDDMGDGDDDDLGDGEEDGAVDADADLLVEVDNFLQAVDAPEGGIGGTAALAGQARPIAPPLPPGRSGSFSSSSNAPPLPYNNLPSPPRATNYYNQPIYNHEYHGHNYAPPSPGYSHGGGTASRRSSIPGYGYANQASGAVGGYYSSGSSPPGGVGGPSYDQTYFADALVGALNRREDPPFGVTSISTTNASANAPLSLPPGPGLATRGRRAGSLASGLPPRPGTSGAAHIYPSSSFAGGSLINPNYNPNYASATYASSMRSTGTATPGSSRRSLSPAPGAFGHGGQQTPRPYSPGPSGSKMSLNAITHPLPPPPPGVIWGYPGGPNALPMRGRSPGPPPGSSSGRATPLGRSSSVPRSGSSVRSSSLHRR